MVLSRRLRTFAAVIVLSGAALAVPTPAAAAVATSDFQLTFSSTTYSDNDGSAWSFQNIINYLDTPLTKVSLGGINLNRYGSDNDGQCYASTPAAITGEICWNDGDNDSSEWYPQGVTTTSDATGGYPSRIITAWYDNCSPDKYGSYRTGCATAPSSADGDGDGIADDHRYYKKGVRLSVFDTSTYTYRLLLLVEPFINASGNATYKAVKIHAGGIAWYGNYLYVADTDHGIRVFDTTQLFDLSVDAVDEPGKILSTDATTNGKVGRQNGTFYSHGYRYILPQVGRWQQNSLPTSADTCTPSGAPKFSYLSIDRWTSPPRLITGEYCDPTDESDTSTFGRVARWNLNSSALATALSATGSATAAEAYRLPVAHVQGVTSHGGTFYLNKSAGTTNEGTLYKTIASGGVLTVDSNKAVAVGCESLSYSVATGDIYSVSEYVGGRLTYYLPAW